MTLEGEHQIGRLDIAMDQPKLVGRLQSEGRLTRHFTSLGGFQPSQAAEDLCQIQTFHEFHCQDQPPLDFLRVVGADDVRVVEPSDGFHLPFQSA